ncbi:MAG: YdcF family protein, partial [Anaerolineales bacterium]|nr:YdcF family protein [Anaerolineales bacterium]
MIYISKLLPQFVYPLGLIGGLIIIALLLQRKPRLQRAILIIALLVLFISGNRWVAMGLSRSLEWQYLPQENIPVADVIVVLGGGTNPAEYPRSTIEINGA